MNDFTYHKPTSLGEAAQLLAHDDAKLLAGGMTLLPTVKQRLATPGCLVDLAAVAELSGDKIRREGNSLTLGAMACHAEVAASETVREAIPALAHLADSIGDPQVRHRGTIGGSLANNDPAADYPSAVLGLGATVVTNKREISADEFFAGMFATVLADDEIIASVRFPIPTKAGYAKFPQPASRYALVGVFAAQTADGARVAVTGAGADGVFRAMEIEQALSSNFSANALDGVAMSADNLIDDLHASSSYRAHLIVVMAKRAVESCN